MKLETNRDLALCQSVEARRALLERNDQAFSAEIRSIREAIVEILETIPGTEEHAEAYARNLRGQQLAKSVSEFSRFTRKLTRSLT